MADFSEKLIQSTLKALKDEFGPEIATRELAILELEDMKRKGCSQDFASRYETCYSCPNSEKCPVIDWEKRHPEYANDELAKKIRILEAGGEEAYKAKLKAQEEAKKRAEEEAKRASDVDRADACRYVLDLYLKSKVGVPEAKILEIANSILYAKTKDEIQSEVAKVTEL